MQSPQETVLEELMQRSFGAQFLYAPRKYRKGNAHREPADLAWVTDDLVILFYLCASSDSLEAQTQHNQTQAAGYHRLWATGRSDYALRGRNRFGDECFVSYSRVKNYLTVLVASKECGIHFAEPLTTRIGNAVIVIPDQLVLWVAEFGGTMVDLLHIIDSYLVHADTNTSNDSSFAYLRALASKYVTESLEKADPEGTYLSGVALQDYLFISQHISRMRIPAEFGGAIQDTKGRNLIAGVFGDLALIEFASLAAGAEKAIRASDPPAFKKWVVLKIQGLYYSFVIGTVHMGSRNFMEATQAALNACKNESGEIDSIYVQYGNVLDANEYRAPLLFTLPPKLPRKHSIELAEQIVKRAKSFVR
jgi:hypothetical protein